MSGVIVLEKNETKGFWKLLKLFRTFKEISLVEKNEEDESKSESDQSIIIPVYEIERNRTLILKYIKEFLNNCSQFGYQNTQFFHYLDFTLRIVFNNNIFCGYISYDGDDNATSIFFLQFEDIYSEMTDDQKSKINLPEGGFAYGTAYDTGMAKTFYFSEENERFLYSLNLNTKRGFLTHHFVVREIKKFIDSILNSDIIQTTQHLSTKSIDMSNIFN